MFRFQYDNSCSEAKEFILSYLLPCSSGFRLPHIITTIIESDQVNECLTGNTVLWAVRHTEIRVLQPSPTFLFFFPEQQLLVQKIQGYWRHPHTNKVVYMAGWNDKEGLCSGKRHSYAGALHLYPLTNARWLVMMWLIQGGGGDTRFLQSRILTVIWSCCRKSQTRHSSLHNCAKAK